MINVPFSNVRHNPYPHHYQREIAMLEFEIFVSSLENPDDQTQMFVNDYQDKKEFMAAAKSYVKGSTGEDKPKIRFEFDDDSVFSGTDLITENNIDERVWEYLTLDDEKTIEMVLAFTALYPEQKGNVSELREIAEQQVVGRFSEITDFGYAFLESKGFMDNLPKIIENNIDIDAISEGLMMSHKTLNNWYFANLDQDGWHLAGSQP